LPFVVIPLSYVRIVASRSVQTAGVDETGTLAVNPDWWSGLDAEAKRYVAIHECMHVVLCHPFRRKGFDPIIYNAAADGKINSSIEEARVSSVSYSRGDQVTLEKISRETGISLEALQRMSTEEIARELEERAVKVAVKCAVGEEGIGRDLLDGTVEGVVVQEGDKSVAEKKSARELEKEWKRILERARDFAKQAGNMPAGLERIVAEVLEVKPPWRLVLRFGVKNHSKQDSSFAYPSRRGDDYPGCYGYRYSAWCLIDCSGSISQEELRHFLGIVKFEARKADIYAIPWDGEAYEVLKASRPADVARKVAPRMRGGGGTVVAPALRKAFSLMKPGDAVIVLTDGDIFDAGSEEAKQLFRKVSAKAGFAMIGYTHTPVDAPGFASARVAFTEDET
jgi:predicted metal-dependent peptidase